MEPYTAPVWLPGGHLQTIYPALLFRRSQIAYRRERWNTPDGDFLDLDWLHPAPAGERAPEPLIVLFHGLEGNSRGHYVLALMREIAALGWRAVAVHFRGCSGEPNRLARAYHSGDAAEIDWILRRFRTQTRMLFAVGVSLGGNALLKWLGEQGAGACTVIAAAAAVSAPLDLSVAGHALGRGFNLVYTRHFLRTLKRKSLAKLNRFPGLYEARAVSRARTLRDFDDMVTAPLHGFRDAADYWERASSQPGLIRIAAPALIINARNDPFLPEHALPRAHEVSAHVELDFPRHGGHAGFVSGPFPGRLDWLPRRMLSFFANINEGIAK